MQTPPQQTSRLRKVTYAILIPIVAAVIADIIGLPIKQWWDDQFGRPKHGGTIVDEQKVVKTNEKKLEETFMRYLKYGNRRHEIKDSLINLFEGIDDVITQTTKAGGYPVPYDINLYLETLEANEKYIDSIAVSYVKFSANHKISQASIIHSSLH